MKLGLVSLVGAGPGDPELLTLRAVARLNAADLVLYDALVDREALRHAPHARWAYVGKRAGRHSIEQGTIERVMIRRAQRGERVVRLKSGGTARYDKTWTWKHTFDSAGGQVPFRTYKATMRSGVTVTYKPCRLIPACASAKP